MLGIYIYICEVTQSCPTLCDPMDCSLPGSSVHGILQARVLEWVAISFSRASSRPRDQTQVSLIGGRRFTMLTTLQNTPKSATLNLQKNPDRKVLFIVSVTFRGASTQILTV